MKVSSWCEAVLLLMAMALALSPCLIVRDWDNLPIIWNVLSVLWTFLSIVLYLFVRVHIDDVIEYHEGKAKFLEMKISSLEAELGRGQRLDP